MVVLIEGEIDGDGLFLLKERLIEMVVLIEGEIDRDGLFLLKERLIEMVCSY